MAIKRFILPQNTLIIDYDDSEETDDHAARIGDLSGFGGGDDGTINFVVGLQFNVTVLEYKYRTITIANGVITSISAESSWTTVPTV